MFEKVQMGAADGSVKVPVVITERNTEIPFSAYQLITTLGALKLMSKGLKFRGMNLKTIKEYFGLKGRTAADCLVELQAIYEAYKGH